jgi:alpha-L-fucosidase 2
MTLDRRSFLTISAAAALPLRSRAASPGNGLPAADQTQSLLVHDNVDWPDFLARHDLLWDTMPTKWSESPFLGNGRLAVSMQAQTGENAVRFAIDNVDVFDRRDPSWGSVPYSRSRYRVGDFVLHPVGQITGVKMRLKLHDAELDGTITTSEGTIQFRALVHAERMIAVVDLEMSPGEQSAHWEWRGADAVSSRKPVRDARGQAEYEKLYGHPIRIWVDNPRPLHTRRNNIDLYVQTLLAGGAYTTAWEERVRSPSHRTLFVSSMMSWPGVESSDEAVAEIRGTRTGGFDRLVKTHRSWWHTYYPQSFVSIPDARLESFYWIQMYKFGCASPKGTGVIDTHGPWLQPTSWPYITWNLNTQIAYWALQPANRCELAEGVFRTLDSHFATLRENAGMFSSQRDVAALGHCSQQDLSAPFEADVRYEREWGNLLWICHNYWLQYRFTMDDRMLRDRLLSLLGRAVAFYLPELEEGSDGKLHLPPTYSPETGTTRDCNYDLALLRWGCGALVRACQRLNLEDARRPRWQDVSDRLVDYPVDEHGFRLGADLPAVAHRHFSHLLMIYPLHTVNWDDIAVRPLIERSVEFWYSAARTGKADSGFTLAAGSSMYSAMGRGDEALECLQALVTGPSSIGRIMPNTMYAESGQNIETPLAAAQAFHDMLLQSWGDILRVFPAVLSQWKDFVFHNLRAEGAFLVSAQLRNGKVSWVRVKSMAGEECRLKCSFPLEPKAAFHPDSGSIRLVGTNLYQLDMKRNQEVLLQCDTTLSQPSVLPLDAPSSAFNFYGVHTRSS